MQVRLGRWNKAQIEEERHQKGKRAKPEGIEDFLNAFPIVDSEFFKGKICIEVGCGITGPIHYLNGSRLSIGIDPLCLKCKELYSDEGTDNVPHISGVGEYLSIRDESTDVVIIYGVLDHCLNPKVVLEEASRVLIKGGSLFLALYTFSRVPKFLRHHLLTLVDRPHPYHFSKQEIIKLAEEAGLYVKWSYSKLVSPKKAVYICKTTSFRSALKTFVASLIGIEDICLILTK